MRGPVPDNRDRLVQAIILDDDLDAARARMEALGFTVEAGGRHPGRGTANLIVPFGAEYLELLAVVDEDEARSSPQGRPVLAALARRGPGLARWTVEPPDIEATSRRLGLPVQRRERRRPDGITVRWGAVGVDEAWEQSWRCAYMAWDDPALHLARRSIAHPNGATGFARLEVTVPDDQAARHWLGGTVPAKVNLRTGGASGPASLVLSTAAGDVVTFDE